MSSRGSRTRLYVGRISGRTRERDLEDLFKRYGRLRNCDLKSGFAFIEYDDDRDASDAIRALDGTNLDGSRIIVERSRGPRPGPKGPPQRTEHRVVVENLPRDISWQDLKDYCRRGGDLVYADVFPDRSGRTRGVVEFRTREDLRRAIKELDGTDLRGNRISIKEDVRRDRERSRSPRRSNRHSRRSRSRSASPRRSRRDRSPASKKRARSRSSSPKKDIAREKDTQDNHTDHDQPSNQHPHSPVRRHHSQSKSPGQQEPPHSPHHSHSPSPRRSHSPPSKRSRRSGTPSPDQEPRRDEQEAHRQHNRQSVSPRHHRSRTPSPSPHRGTASPRPSLSPRGSRSHSSSPPPTED